MSRAHCRCCLQPHIQVLSPGFVVINDVTFINIDYLHAYRDNAWAKAKPALDALINDINDKKPKLEAF